MKRDIKGDIESIKEDVKNVSGDIKNIEESMKEDVKDIKKGIKEDLKEAIKDSVQKKMESMEVDVQDIKKDIKEVVKFMKEMKNIENPEVKKEYTGKYMQNIETDDLTNPGVLHLGELCVVGYIFALNMKLSP